MCGSWRYRVRSRFHFLNDTGWRVASRVSSRPSCGFRMCAPKMAYSVSVRSLGENSCRLKGRNFSLRTPAGHVSTGKERGLVKWHGSCGLQSGSLASCFASAHGRREVFMEHTRNESEYDLYSAVTFLLVGLGIGSVLAMVFDPKQRVAPEGINSRRMSGLQPRREVEERAA